MRGSVARRLYRAALRLLPSALRRKHGGAMEALFARRLERAGPGLRGRLAVVLNGLWDVAARALYERARLPAASPGRRSEGESPLSRLLHEFRFAFRSLRRSPRFTLLAVLTLSLGIGANVALFSVVHGVILRPLPFPDEERVVHLAWDRGAGVPRVTVPAYKFEFWRGRSRVFQAMTTWRANTFEVGRREEGGVPLGGLRVSRDFLDVVGWEPALGRGFTAEDDRPGAPEVVLLGHDTWATRFAGDPGLLGRTIEVDGVPHTVIGVLPRDFDFPHEPEREGLLVPLRLEPDPLDEGENWPLLARLADGVSVEAARSDLDRVYAAFERAHPELMNDIDRAMVISSYRELYLGGVQDVLWSLMGATALVLLIACANVAALLLARGTSRRGELGVRVALGAGRGRIVGQILAESVLLAAMAAVVGLGLAALGVDGLLGLYPGALPRAEAIGVNASVAVYGVGAGLLTGGLFGLLAALPVLRGGVASVLRESSRGGTGRGGIRKLVLASEAAVSVVLLVGAGLLIATLAEIRSVDPGFEVSGLLAAPLPEPAGGWEAAGGVREVERRTLEELEALPSVSAAAAASTHPLRRGLNIPVGIQGRPELYEGAVEWRATTPGYLEALGVPLLSGRSFAASDGAGAPPVALVNRAFVDRYFPGESALGKRIEIGRYRDRYIHPSFDVGGVEIVGVVSDVREIDLKVEPRRTVYVPADQVPGILLEPSVLLVRERDGSTREAVRRVLAGVARPGAVPEIRTMEEVVGDSMGAERFNAFLMGLFALVALLLTAFGIYGVVSYGVRQRRREIGIRMALGARPAEVTRLVMAQGMLPVLSGLAVGVVGALALTRFIESLLWGVGPTEPLPIALVVTLLGAVGALASWIPVREATAIDPNRTLRPE